VKRSGTLLNFGFMPSAKNSTSRNLSRESVSPGNPRRAKVQTNGEETEVSFDLSTDEKQTFLQFRHSGWRESTDFQGHCSMRWAVFLLSLKDVLERGKGRPYPYDLEVHYR